MSFSQFFKNDTVDLFWFSKSKLQNKDILNFGDDINPWLVEKVSGKKVVWRNPQKQNFWDRKLHRINFAIGSILHFAPNNANIWGSGLIDSKSKFPTQANYYAVRGPQTQKIITKKGVKVPEIYGDPALLLPKYHPVSDKKYTLGIIPHYTEVEEVKTKLQSLPEDIKIIDLKGEVLEVLDEITACEKIASSSLHGLIVGMAYDIPSLRIQLSNKIYGDGIKYEDFYQSVGIPTHRNIPIDFAEMKLPDLQEYFKKDKDLKVQNNLSKIQEDLLNNQAF